MKNLGIVILNTIIFFVIINIFIVLAWPIFSDFRNKRHSYSNEVAKLIDLEEDDLIILENETWRKDYKFIYQPFIGHTEIDKTGKFVNFSFKDGRKVNRPKNCEKNLYMYGGSTTFGYGVTDYQTISEYLQKELSKDYCVYNHGKASYYSLQENNLFFNHIEINKKIDYAIFLDGINEKCGGHFAAQSLSDNFSAFSEKPYLLWKKSLRTFFYSMPIYQLALKFGSNDWINDKSIKSFLSINTCEKNITLDELFEKRIKARVSLCEKFNVTCYTFLQPFPGISGKHSDLLINDEELNYHKKKYFLLSKIKNNIIDLQHVLKNDYKLSYIDAVHYSPETNLKLAREITKIINKNE